MKVLVTGGAGYLGSVLVPKLLSAGHEVTVLDRFFFGTDTLPTGKTASNLHTIRQDTRWCDGRTVEGYDALVDLAALSNDPAGALEPWKTYEINYLGRSRMARLAKHAKVRRYVAASSCSVYGFQSEILTEKSPPHPLTEYARANVLVEQDNLPLSNEAFCVTALRFATLYGPSPRMRFDLAINGMVLGGWKKGVIPVMRDGTQWRPFLHVADAADVVSRVLDSPEERIRGQVFNVGSDDQNFQLFPLAGEIARSMDTRPETSWYGDPDTRSYRVSFEKVRATLDFTPVLRPPQAVREIESALRSNALQETSRTLTVDWYRHLLSDPEAGAAVALNGVVI